MYSFQTYVTVPADRRVTITLPPGVPIGPAEVELSLGWPPPDADAVESLSSHPRPPLLKYTRKSETSAGE